MSAACTGRADCPCVACPWRRPTYAPPVRAAQPQGVLVHPHPQDNLPPLELEPDPGSAWGTHGAALEAAAARAAELTAAGMVRIDPRDSGHHHPDILLATTGQLGGQAASEIWAAAWRVELRRAVQPERRDGVWFRRMVLCAGHNLEHRAALLALTALHPWLPELLATHPAQVAAWSARTELLHAAQIAHVRSGAHRQCPNLWRKP